MATFPAPFSLPAILLAALALPSRSGSLVRHFAGIEISSFDRQANPSSTLCFIRKHSTRNVTWRYPPHATRPEDKAWALRSHRYCFARRRIRRVWQSALARWALARDSAGNIRDDGVVRGREASRGTAHRRKSEVGILERSLWTPGWFSTPPAVRWSRRRRSDAGSARRCCRYAL
jgi:hypothetical protein